VVQNPDSGEWIEVTNILEGIQGHQHPGGHDKSATHHFTGVDHAGGERKFDSYVPVPGANPALPPRNLVITRAVKE